MEPCMVVPHSRGHRAHPNILEANPGPPPAGHSGGCRALALSSAALQEEGVSAIFS